MKRKVWDGFGSAVGKGFFKGVCKKVSVHDKLVHIFFLSVCPVVRVDICKV